MKHYELIRKEWNTTVWVQDGEGRYMLEGGQHVLHLSVEFGWGKNNCKTNQLAFALLLDATKDENIAMTYFSHYAEEVLSKISLFHTKILLSEVSIHSWMKAKLSEKL